MYIYYITRGRGNTPSRIKQIRNMSKGQKKSPRSKYTRSRSRSRRYNKYILMKPEKRRSRTFQYWCTAAYLHHQPTPAKEKGCETLRATDGCRGLPDRESNSVKVILPHKSKTAEWEFSRVHELEREIEIVHDVRQGPRLIPKIGENKLKTKMRGSGRSQIDK
jgi:hypothetical protein